MAKNLKYTASLDINEAKRAAEDLKRTLSSLGISPAGTNGFTIAQGRMTKAMRDALLESERLRQENVRLRNEYEQGRITAQQLAAQTRALNEQRRQEAIATREARRNQVAATGSYREAQQRLAALGREIRETAGGFSNLGREQRARIQEYRQLNAQLTEFDRTMGNHQRNVGNYGSALEGLKGLAATYLSGAAILAAGKQILDINIEIADSLSDVQRTAGLTATEVNNLSIELQKIDTRTSLKGLLDIATIGGQLGIAKDQLVGFTTAVDQLAVSLGGELEGGAEGIAKSLGVLDNVFKITQGNAGNVEKSYNQIGSAILGLGQSGLATGDFLADFGERVGGLAKQAGLSLPVILSYGAVLQENGVSAEVAGSAFKRLLSSLATNREKFFAVAQLADANLTLKDFTKTINTDSKKALDLFFAGLAKGGTTTTSFNDILKSLKLTGAGVSQTVAALSNGQAELNGHIEQATKDFDAATLSAEQYALKNDNLAGSWDKLGNTIRNAFTSGPVAGFFKVLIDGLNDATKKFIGITQSKSWMEFFTRITPFANTKGFDINNRIAENFKAGTSTSYDLNSIYDKQINGGGVSPAELKKAYNDAVAATKSALKDYQDFEKGLKSGDLKNTNGQLGTLANRFRYLRDQTAYFTDEYNKAKAKLPKDATVTSGGADLDLSGGKTTKAEAKKLETALNSQRVLQAKIDEQNDKGKRKQLDSDAQEIEAVKAKYAKLREEADRFNANKDNKKRGLKVDASGLVRAESTESDALVDKQAAVKLKVQLDDQKKLYEEFEQFKLTFGEAKAKERYKIEGTYLQYLADQQAKILGYDEKAKGGDAGGGSLTTQQAKVLEEANKQALEIQQKRTDALLKEFMGYAEKRKVLIQNYERDFADLESNPSAQAERTKRYEKDLKELDDANAKKLDSYQTLFEGIESLSQKQALKVLQAGRAQLAKDIKAGAIVDPAEIAKVKKYFDDVEVTIREGSGQALMDLARQVDEIASSVGGIDAAFGKVLGTLGNLLGQVGNIKKGFKDLQLAQSKGSVTGQLTAGLGIFGAGLSIFQSVVSLFSKQEQREAQASYARDLQNKQTEALNKALERQVALLNDVYGTDRIRDYSAAIKQAQENQAKYANELVGKYTLTGDQQLDEFITKLNNGEKIDPTFAGLVAKAKKASSILPTDINTLQRLMDEGKLDANTATIVTNLIKAKETADQLVNSLRAETVGTTLEQIADDFISTLTDGTKDFGKTFEATIQKSLLNGFKGELIRKQLQAFYSQFAELSEGGLTAQEIETLRQSYLTASEKAKADLEALSKATGIDLIGKNTNNNNSLKGALTSASQDSINILAGYTAGVRLQLVKVEAATIALGGGKSLGDLYLTAKGGLDQLVMIESNTRRTADNTAHLAEVRDILKSMKGPGNYNPYLSGSGQTPP